MKTNYLNDIASPFTQLLAAYDGETGALKADYSYGLERIAVHDEDTTTGNVQDPLYYLYDGLGSVTQLTNPAGQVRDKYAYDEFGNQQPGGKMSPNAGNVLNNPFGYSGEQWDDESGLIYLRARYYDSEIGRFVNRDTYKGEYTNPLSLNKYSYVENNPVNYVDPTGFNKIGVRYINGKRYYDYTIPFNQLLERNAELCKEHRASDPFNPISATNSLFWFKSKVDNGAVWDIKLPNRWKEQLPGVPFLGLTGEFIWNGVIITAESAGNITYGYWGRSMGFGPLLLYWGGGVAKLHSVTSPELMKPPFYGDAPNDHSNIKRGINLYDLRYRNDPPIIEMNPTLLYYILLQMIQ